MKKSVQTLAIELIAHYGIQLVRHIRILRLLERFTNVEKFSFEDSDLNCGSK